MTKGHLSPLELALMESRFQKMNKAAALRDFRRKQAQGNGASQHPASLKSQKLVKEIKALEMSGAASKARQKALDAFTKSPSESFASSIRDAANRLPADEGTSNAQKYLILSESKDENYLMVVNDLSGSAIFATTINAEDGSKVLGFPMIRINPEKMKGKVTMFASLGDAHAFARMNDLKMATH